MSEERADEVGAISVSCAVMRSARGFALLQRPACAAGAFCLAPDLLIGVEIRGVAGKVLR
jgi:hypothetical protein